MAGAEEAKSGTEGPAAIGEAERLDEDGLPVDRVPTLDDVRSDAGSGRAIAVGCTSVVAAVVILFWLLRAGMLG